jgi:hypothetical protein
MYHIGTVTIPATKATKFIIFKRIDGRDVEMMAFDTKDAAEGVLLMMKQANEGLIRPAVNFGGGR